MKRLMIGLLVAAQALTASAFASTRGHLNTAGLLSGAALYSIYNYGRKTHSAGRRNTALLTTAGAAYAWSRYNQSKRADKRRSLARAYSRGYSTGSYRSRARYGGSGARYHALRRYRRTIRHHRHARYRR